MSDYFSTPVLPVINRTIADHKLIDVSIIKKNTKLNILLERKFISYEIVFGILIPASIRDSFDRDPPIQIYVHCNMSDESCLPMHGNMFRRIESHFTVGINALIRVYEATLCG